MQNTGKSVLRVSKNYIKGYSDVQKKVRDATSNEPWGPSGEQMNTLAQLSYNQNEFVEMMELLDKRLNDKGKNWRHVFKALTLLDYLLHAGSENVVIYFRDNIYVVKTLKEFMYVDEMGKDQGANVRQKAKDITNLLSDEQRLREERRSRASMRNRMTDGGEPQPQRPQGDFEDDEGRRRRAEAERRKNARRENEDEELRRAIEESKRMAREEQEKLRREATDEDELQKALALSREEEEKRIKELEERNKNALFDDDFNLIDAPPNQYAQQEAWNQQQQQFMQPQYTSFNPYMQAQPTGYNPFLQQQMALQQQQEAEYQRQMELQMAAQQYQHLMTQQQQMQPLQPQPTAFGSNNPFAAFPQQQQQQQPPQQMYQPPPQQQQQVPIADLLGSSEPAPTPQPQQQPQQQQQQPPRHKTNDKYAELDKLLASGEAQDTFGNTGNRVMGHSANRPLGAQQTGAQNGQQQQQQQQQQQGGSNPFFQV